MSHSYFNPKQWSLLNHNKIVLVPYPNQTNLFTMLPHVYYCCNSDKSPLNIFMKVNYLHPIFRTQMKLKMCDITNYTGNGLKSGLLLKQHPMKIWDVILFFILRQRWDDVILTSFATSGYFWKLSISQRQSKWIYSPEIFIRPLTPLRS